MNRNESLNSQALSVSELNRQVRTLLEYSIGSISVEGEISNLARPSSGHWYFTLKDRNAQVRCAMFRNRNRLTRFQPKEGDQVVVVGKVSLYEGRGDYQLICESLSENGFGRLQQAFEELKRKLDAEGLFAAQRKRALPTQIRRVGVVTSATGAAIHDILTVFKRRFPALPVTLYPTRVQGDEAPDEICRAIDLANRHGTCDVLIVGRGGGSLEDLWSFNEERVARAIVASEIPVVSAVGHEVDISIADLVADLRAPTPSAAAELLSPDQAQLAARVAQLRQRLTSVISRQLQHQRLRLNHSRQRLRHPGERLRERIQRVDQLEIRLKRATTRLLEQRKGQLEQLKHRLQQIRPEQRLQRERQNLERLNAALTRRIKEQLQYGRLRLDRQVGRLEAISPLATLHRGYSILLTEDGKAVTDAQQVTAGEKLSAKLSQGELLLQVESATASQE